MKNEFNVCSQCQERKYQYYCELLDDDVCEECLPCYPDINKDCNECK